MSYYPPERQRAATMERPGFVLYVILFAFICKEGLTCNPGWSERYDRCFHIIPNNQDFRIARRYCQIYGGDLAFVDSFLTLQFLHTLEHYEEMYDYWLSENNTVFVSENNTSTDSEDACFFLSGIEFRHSNCEEKRHFICEVAKNKQISGSLTWSRHGRNWYKIMPDNSTYEEALNFCTNQQGTLAIVDGIEKEHEVAAAIVGLNTTFMVGAQNTNGTILWSNGKPFVPSCSQCFVAHSTGECLGFQSDAEHPLLFSWVHLDCNAQNRFLCETAPLSTDSSPSATTPPLTPPPPPTPPSTLPTTTLAPLQCPHGNNWKVHRTSGYCYWETTYETVRLNWFQARKFCQNMGGDLATYQDALQESVGLGGAKNHYRGLWFGLKRSTDNVFSWVDGSPLNYTNWNYREPKLESTTKFCVVHGADESKWELDYCGVRRWFICKAPQTRSVVIPDTSTFSIRTRCNFTDSTPFHSWYPFEDHCYLTRDLSYTWHTAKNFCNDNNAHLLSLHSFEETDFVISLLSAISTRSLWIGLSARGIGSTLEWSDGTPLDFFYWPDGLSANSTRYDVDICVDFNSQTGAWSEAHCNEFKKVVCKRPLNSSYEFTTPEPTPLLPGHCPQNWVQFGNKCFRVYGAFRSERLDFNASAISCESEQAKLASIHSDEENDFVVDLLLSTGNEAWIGLYAKQSHFMQWMDESPLDYTNTLQYTIFHRTMGTHQCFKLKDNTGTWRFEPESCGRQLPYICQKDKDPSLTEPSKDPFECTNITGWYKLRSTCYGIFETDAWSWNSAQRKCKEFNGDLVTFQNDAVGSFLKKRLTKKDNFFWIGVRQTTRRNQYGLVNSKRMQITNWLTSQPVAAAPYLENCVAMNSQGYWVVKDCKEPHNFICEWNSDAESEKKPLLHSEKHCPSSNIWIDLGSDRCYIFKTDYKMTWSQGSHYCFKQGGHLASFHSEAEQSLVMQHLMTKNYYFEFLIGLAERHDGSYSWLDGSPLDFVNWDPNAVDDVPLGHSKCVKINVDTGLWKKTSCSLEASTLICSVQKNGVPFGETRQPNDSLTNEKKDDISKKLTVGGIFGILICLLVVVAIASVAAYYMCPSTRMRVPLEECDSL